MPTVMLTIITKEHQAETMSEWQDMQQKSNTKLGYF